MPRIRHTVEQIITMLREAGVAISKAQPVAQACRTLGITEQLRDELLNRRNCWLHCGRCTCSWNVGDDTTTRLVPIGHRGCDHPLLKRSHPSGVRKCHSIRYNHGGPVTRAGPTKLSTATRQHRLALS
jgi:hypothetical protein